MSRTNEVEAELESGEQLLWTGTPRSGIVFRPIDIFLVPFSLFWFGGVIFMNIKASSHGNAPPMFAIVGAVFLVAGMYIVFGRFAVDAWMRSRTHYGITSSRVIIVSTAIVRRTKTLNLVTLAETTLTERANGYGSIRFGSQLPFFMGMQGGMMPGMSGLLPPCFEVIPDARAVYQTLREAQRKTRPL